MNILKLIKIFHKEQMSGKMGSNQENQRLKSLKRKY